MIRSSILGVAACVWLALGAACFPLRAELKPEDLYSAVLPSIITLDVENVAGQHFIGTGFLAVGDGLAVTAWHVVHDARGVRARYSDGQEVMVSGLVDKNEQLDTAIIKLDGPARPKIKLSPAAPRIGSRIYVMGSPRGFDFSIGEGLISQVRTLDNVRYYQLSCPISPGDSGGPVLNECGEAIGLVSWRKADAENVGFAVPCAAIVGMDAAHAPVAWVSVQGGAVATASESSAPSRPFVREAAAAPVSATTDDYRTLQQFLSGLAGQRVSIIVQGQGTSRSFNIEMPRNPPQ
jgi:serine protease Do